LIPSQDLTPHTGRMPGKSYVHSLEVASLRPKSRLARFLRTDQAHFYVGVDVSTFIPMAYLFQSTTTVRYHPVAFVVGYEVK